MHSSASQNLSTGEQWGDFWELFLGNFLTARLHISLPVLSFCVLSWPSVLFVVTDCEVCHSSPNQSVGHISQAPQNKPYLWRRAHCFQLAASIWILLSGCLRCILVIPFFFLAKVSCPSLAAHKAPFFPEYSPSSWNVCTQLEQGPEPFSLGTILRWR